jgi:hypothetical protein
MGHVLELSLETIEKELPINMQQPLLMQMCQHYPNDKYHCRLPPPQHLSHSYYLHVATAAALCRTHEVDFYRWVLRALMRNVGLNFITPSLPAGSTQVPPVAASAGDTLKSDTMDEDSGSAREREEKEREAGGGKKPSSDASVPARTFLKGWVGQHRDYRLDAAAPTQGEPPADRMKLEKYLMVVPFELGEFHFFIEDFAEAEKLFILARDRATAFAAKYPSLDPKKWYALPPPHPPKPLTQ